MRKRTKISNWVNMDKLFKRPSGKKFLLGLVIALLGIFGILLWKAHTLKPAAPIEKEIEPKKEKPPERAKVVLRSSLAGQWYPADAETLSRQIEGFFQKAGVGPISDVIALILPHAGYSFSGQTAASALKTTDKKYKRVVIIGPSHYVSMEEVLTVPRVTHYETPLGEIPLDVEFIDELLLQYPMFQNVPQAHKLEHSVQIELPLLQHSQRDFTQPLTWAGFKLVPFKLVPIVAGTCSPETISRAGAILRGLAEDFVHYGSRFGYVPFKENIPEQIKKLDMGAYEHIARLDAEGFLEYKQRTGATICGYVPIAILLSMLEKPEGSRKAGPQAHLIKYTTSGELTGDFTNSVSYLSVAFSGSWQAYPAVEQRTSNPGLSEEDKKQLLALARKSIAYFLKHWRIPEESELGVTISEAMKCPCAAFVTLKKNSQLRGCIGDIFPQRPLCRSVIINAVNASVRDRRFRPVTIAECSDITIEISALTAPEPIASPDEIRIGTDGVVLSKDGKSAVFLPQVAPQQGWDVNQMLTQLSLKAKLPADAWKEGANFLVFQADAFGEEE